MLVFSYVCILIQVRVEAMHHLLQFPVGDLVAMETWAQLKPVLSDALMDSDSSLAVRADLVHSLPDQVYVHVRVHVHVFHVLFLHVLSLCAIQC